MRRRLSPPAAGCLAAALVAGLAAGCRRSGGGAESAASLTPSPPPVAIVLYFPGDDDLLHRESREVPELPAQPSSRIRLVVEELIAGSHTGLAAAFPWPATVDAVFVDHSKNAYIDLSSPPAEAVAGTATELAVTYATASSVVANCPGVERVQLLFGGHEVATLGHLDLSHPLPPRPELIAP